MGALCCLGKHNSEDSSGGVKALGSGGKCPMLGDLGSQPIHAINSPCKPRQVIPLPRPWFLMGQWDSVPKAYAVPFI